MGWDYALSWLTILPFELTAASITIKFWRSDLNVGIWIAIFLVFLSFIQIFGVRGYGEVEFILSMIKIMACVGFIILGIVINCGGVGNQGYIGFKYWSDPGAFNNGFNGFASVFVVASFAFGGTELVGLAAAESANPRKAIPTATKQVFWRIAFFYIVNLFILGLIIKSSDERLLGSSGANTKASPFVLAIQDAGIKVLPSIFNTVITLAVISVANSCTFGSTRTMQALAERGMGPKFLAYIDKKGRPIWCILIQVAFGFLAFIGEATDGGTIFAWLLSLSGLSFFFVWGSICLAHIRFRSAWKAQGFTLNKIPYKPTLGVIGSWIGLVLNVLCLIATFYSALYVSISFVDFLPIPIIVLTANSYSRVPVRSPTPSTSSSSTSLPPSSSRSTSDGRCTLGNGGCMCPSWRSTSRLACACLRTMRRKSCRSRLGPICPCALSAVSSRVERFICGTLICYWIKKRS